MRRIPILIVLSLVVGGFFTNPVAAATSRRWVSDTREDFEAGEREGVVTSSDGDMRLGLETSPVEVAARVVWDARRLSDGTLFLATGDPAGLWKVSDGKALRLQALDAVAATALAVGGKELYVATLGDGRIFRLDWKALKAWERQRGEIKKDKKKNRTEKSLAAKATKVLVEVVRLPVPYIWCLAVLDKHLYAGTGPDGTVYRIPLGKAKKAKAQVWFESEQLNCLSLAVDAGGKLLVGTSQEGLLYRVLGKGKAEVLHDFDEDEVKSILVDGEDLIVAVNTLRQKRPQGDGGARKAASFDSLTRKLLETYAWKEEVKRLEAARRGKEDFLPGGRRQNLKGGVVYRIDAVGRVEVIWHRSSEYVLDLALDAKGRVWVASGPRGRVYSVVPNKIEFTELDLEQDQAMALVVEDGAVRAVATGNEGGLLQISVERAKKGSFHSKVLDAGFRSRWGRCHFEASRPLDIRVRSGNTEEPGPDWSAWKPLPSRSGVLVTVPAARFLQYKVGWARGPNEKAVLSKITFYYRSANQRPRLREVTVTLPELKGTGALSKTRAKKASGKDGSNKGAAADALAVLRKKLSEKKSTTSRRSSERRGKASRGQARLRWKAADPDGDTVTYRIHYRAEGESLWMEITDPEKPHRSTSYSWDTETVADGRYQVKVVASDRESNGPADALRDERISDVFVIDNGRPSLVITHLDGKTGIVRGKATDPTSVIRRLAYSLDGKRYRPLVPKDGIFDYGEEVFEFRLTDLQVGPHALSVKAIDNAGNVGLVRKGFKVEQ